MIKNNIIKFEERKWFQNIYLGNNKYCNSNSTIRWNSISYRNIIRAIK